MQTAWDGVDVEEDYQRVYTDSTYFAHVIGYTGKASSEELETLNADYAEGEERYELGDVIGKTGIEASWNRSCRESRVAARCIWTAWDTSWK